MNKCIKIENIFEGKRFNVLRKTYENENGDTYIRECIETQSAAVVLAITNDNEVLFVKQSREVIGEETIELPAGVIENGEDPIETAKRELEEETGYKAVKIEPMIEYYASCGYTNEKLHIFLASELEIGNTKYDIDEQIHDIIKIPLEECYKLQKENYFKHANTNIALLMHEIKNRK